jgi:hypothetical protein
MTDDRDPRPSPTTPRLVPIIGEIGEGGVVTFYPGPYANALEPAGEPGAAMPENVVRLQP